MNLTLEEKIGQMIIVRIFDKKITPDLEDMIKNYKIGGVILYSRNYDTYDEMINLINELKKINKKYNKIPLFISIDQEGGRVNRFPKEIKNTPSSKKICKDKKVLLKTSKNISKTLHDCGFNMNFAPVLDIQRFEDNHAIGDRCFGKTEKEVIENAFVMMNELNKNKVISVVKHFPGHGMINKDTHLFLPFVKKELSEIEKSDLLPFISAIDNGVDAIMVGHIILSKIDPFYPASLSKKVIKNLLINKYNYNGLIITDDIKMKSISILYGHKKALLKAIDAGNNIVVAGIKYNNIIDSINYVSKKAIKNTSLIDDIDNSISKIIEIKNKYEINDNKVEKIDIETISKRFM